MEEIILPALLVLLSSVLRSFIVNKKSTLSIIWEIFLGLPVDLTFIGLSLAISSSKLLPYWSDHRAVLTVLLLIIASIQLGAIYKPCKEYIDEDKNFRSFFLWVLNATITFVVFCFLVMKVV